MMEPKKTAVILLNLGGPDSLPAVEPFLFNLFYDKAILGLPLPFRWCLARLISHRRAPLAKEIYAQIGGKSPILPETEKQAKALESKLNAEKKNEYRVFIAMRYWHPLTEETVRQVKAFAPDEIVLLPLYPQYSTTTTASSFRKWRECARKEKLSAPLRWIESYPENPGFIAAHVALLNEAIKHIPAGHSFRLLFSAHGLPEKVIKKGDPYQQQVEQTVEAIMAAPSFQGLDYHICYQSRVGPLKWIGPSTEEEIALAGQEGKSVVLVPVAFVSEHSETLVELDKEYRSHAEKCGVPHYIRVPTLSCQEDFIRALAEMVIRA